MKGVFDTKPGSGYDDDVTRRYHFPSRYSDAVQACLNNWVVLRRPRADGGNLAYFAVARVARIDPDPAAAGRAYARLSDFLPFDAPVPWIVDGRYGERVLRELPRVQVGVYLRGRSVRLLDEADFTEIVAAGLKDTTDPANAHRYGLDPNAPELIGFRTGPALEQRARAIERALASRIVREASFRRMVCEAYDNCCAVTKLRIINGGGRSEVQAAHIWPVSAGGPDVVQNGLALSGTVHWLFDRHFISITDDYRLLVAHNRIPGELQALFTSQNERVHLPANQSLWPHPSYLARHRDMFAAA